MAAYSLWDFLFGLFSVDIFFQSQNCGRNPRFQRCQKWAECDQLWRLLSPNHIGEIFTSRNLERVWWNHLHASIERNREKKCLINLIIKFFYIWWLKNSRWKLLTIMQPPHRKNVFPPVTNPVEHGCKKDNKYYVKIRLKDVKA